jgi:PAS domain S-box-containing protein
MLAIRYQRPISQRTVFVMAAIACGVFAAVVLGWIYLQLGGDAATTAVDDVAETLSASIAAAACVYAARLTGGRLRSAWILLALSAASWGLGQLVWSIYEVGYGVSLSSPSAADVGFLAAIPFAVAGVLALPAAPNTRSSRWRALLDGAIVAGSLIFVAWAFGLGDVFLNSSLGGLGRTVAAAYPAGDIVVVTLLVLVLRRSRGRLRLSILLLLTGYLANLVADALFTYETVGGTFVSLGGLFDTGWVVGYLLVALAALWPTGDVVIDRSDSTVEPWQLALPWLGVVAVMVVAVWAAVTNRSLDVAATAVAGAVGALFITSQGLLLGDTVRLANRSRRAEVALQERTSQLNEVINRAPVGIARINVKMRIMDANPRLCGLLSAPQSLLVNSRVLDYLPPDQLALAVDRFSALIDGSVESIEGESRVRRMDGTDTWLHWIGTAVRRANGKIDYFLGMFEDFSAKHETEQAALANLAASERLNRLKSEFMSMVSHEFRTALTGIQGYSEIMSSQPVTPDEVKEFSGDINADALRLNRMITEMLDLDRLESGRIVLHLAPLDLEQVARDQVARAQVTTTGHSIKVDFDSALPLVDGDSDRLVEVISNLLSNAIKYSPEGGEILVMGRLKDGNVEISVRDHGLGIPPEFIGRIFGRYERYEGTAKTQVVGTGLGLAIAQQIVQLHKGRIWVESTSGEGSVFSFAIPARPPHPVVRPSPQQVAGLREVSP